MDQLLGAKPLYRRLNNLFGAVDPRRPARQLLEAFLDDAFGALRDDLRLVAGLLYAERRDGFELLSRVGAPIEPVGETLDPMAPPLRLLFRHRVYIFGDPLAAASPAALGLLPAMPAAAIVVGRRPERNLLFFVLGEDWAREELDFVLNTVRAALGARLTDERMRGSVRQAAEIQQSLLLDEPPEFQGFSIACRSLATEEVGGDFFDFFSFDEEMLGLAIGDASGHGLPAALLVRDVVTGLRMGIEKDLKLAHVFGKLNRVIHRSALSSRFVSVFYGELETNGTLIYCNAGHQPPLLFAGGRRERLMTGGTVIGPLPEVRFGRGFARLEPGAVLVLCTDGIVERSTAAGDHFEEEGVARVVQERAGARADELLEALFQAAYDHGAGRPWEDDATAVVVVRDGL